MKQADSASGKWSGGCSDSFQLTTQQCCRNLWFKTKFFKLCASLFLGSVACERVSVIFKETGLGWVRGKAGLIMRLQRCWEVPVNRGESQVDFTEFVHFWC